MRVVRRREKISALVSLLLIGTGLVTFLLAVYGANLPALTGDTNETPATAHQQNQPVSENLASVPENKTFSITITKMDRVKDVTVQDGPASDEPALRQGALHVRGTGLPWQKDTNVYIAGHRMGYAGTGSFLIFYDLDKLQKNDKVVLTDANDTKYTYAVYKKTVVDPSDVSVTGPVPGKSVLTLQTCTLPNFSQRLIVQASLTDVS